MYISSSEVGWISCSLIALVLLTCALAKKTNAPPCKTPRPMVSWRFNQSRITITCSSLIKSGGHLTWVIGSENRVINRHFSHTDGMDPSETDLPGLTSIRPQIKSKGCAFRITWRLDVNGKMFEGYSFACLSRHVTFKNMTALSAPDKDKSYVLKHPTYHASSPELIVKRRSEGVLVATCSAYVGSIGNLTWVLNQIGKKNYQWTISFDSGLSGTLPDIVQPNVFAQTYYDRTSGPRIGTLVTFDERKVARVAGDLYLACYSQNDAGSFDEQNATDTYLPSETKHLHEYEGDLGKGPGEKKRTEDLQTAAASSTILAYFVLATVMAVASAKVLSVLLKKILSREEQADNHVVDPTPAPAPVPVPVPEIVVNPRMSEVVEPVNVEMSSSSSIGEDEYDDTELDIDVVEF